jgi:uncharacterized protein DUF3500
MKRLLLVAVLGLTYVAGITRASEKSAAAMTAAANKWLGSLSAEQRQQATFPIDSDEHQKWHFIPVEQFPRNGLTMGAMSESQRALAHDLVKTGLSAKGYTAATTIMSLENVLRAMEAPGTQFARDPLAYRLSVFGTPGDKHAWGWRLEGHHISLHFDVLNVQARASAPAFFGSNPAEVRTDAPGGPPKGTRALGFEEDAARALLDSLSDDQRKVAIVETTAPRDIVTGNKLQIDPLSPVGVKASALSSAQREKLQQLLDAYTSLMASDLAAERIAAYKKAGIENIAFAWAGETERGKKHYYRVQGPTFLIEYDNTQNDGNHIHSVWRDFNGDFGRDVLREHLKSVPH